MVILDCLSDVFFFKVLLNLFILKNMIWLVIIWNIYFKFIVIDWDVFSLLEINSNIN